MDEADRTTKTARLAFCREQGEKAYDGMYEAHSFRDACDCYRDAKEFFSEAIMLAGELGLGEDREALGKRLDHIRAVYHHQFIQ